MPILPENRHRYPDNWPEIRDRILERAGHRCEFCGVLNHAIGYRQPDGAFVMTNINEGPAMVWPAAGELMPYKDGERYLEIVLTIAHLDHTPENNDPENLAALCQQCHNRYDVQHRQQTRKQRRALGDLFE